jgi:Holliday junction resolvase RusA-like endonuclease
MRIVIPGNPDRVLSPNRRAHWSQKALATKRLREWAYWPARQAVIESDDPIPIFAGAVRVKPTIAWGKGRKRMDGDNALGCLKPVWDGFTDAGFWGDDRYVIFEPVEQIRDPEGVGYVAVEVEAV